MAKCTPDPIKALREHGLVRQVRKRLPSGSASELAEQSPTRLLESDGRSRIEARGNLVLTSRTGGEL